MRDYYVYILASKRNGTLYVGSTSNLAGRVYAHRNGLVQGFTKKYGVHSLVYYEVAVARVGGAKRNPPKPTLATAGIQARLPLDTDFRRYGRAMTVTIPLKSGIQKKHECLFRVYYGQ